MAKFTSTLEKFDSNLWGYHFPIAVEEANRYIEGTNRRIICHINGMHKMQCALMPMSGNYFILINKGLVNKLQLKVGQEVLLDIEKDHTEYGQEMPESFSVLLEQDDEGRQYFEKLTPGKQRSLIYIVKKVKNIDSQLNKGLAILDHLKVENGVLDFKKLNALIKVYNQRGRMKE